MGIAVDRNFATNQRIYVCASRNDYGRWLNQVLRYRIDQWNRIIFEKFVIRFGMAANTVHNGCAIEMFSDGMLWVTMGDAGNPANAQNLELTQREDPARHAGRRRAGQQSGHWRPPDARLQLGHRNPQGITTQPGTGAVYAVEHGPDRDDEINRILGGSNFGWPCYTGAGMRNTPYGGPCSPASSYSNPVWASGSTTWATSNATFFVTPNWGDWNGQLVVATLKEMDLRHYTLSGSAMVWDGAQHVNDSWRKRSVVHGPGGTLYFTTSNGSNDRIVRLTPS